MFRRVILTRRFSPRATSPTRSLHSLRDLSVNEIRDTAILWVSAVMAGAGVGWIHKSVAPKATAPKVTGANETAPKATAPKPTAPKPTLPKGFIDIKKRDMKTRFEHWAWKMGKTYRDEEEKAMRFQLFKKTVEWMESFPPEYQARMFPEINAFADYTKEEKRMLLAFPDGISETNWCGEDDSMKKKRGQAVKPVDLQATEEEECRPAVKLLDVQATKEEENRPDVKRADTRATKAAA